MSAQRMHPSDGVAVQTFQVARELASRGHRIVVAYLEAGAYEADYRAFAEHVLPVTNFKFSLRRPWEAASPFLPDVRRGARCRPDVVYDNLLWSLPWSLGCATASRAPLVGHMHGFIPGGPGIQQRVLMRSVKRLVAVSDFARGQLIDHGVGGHRVTVVHNGIDPDIYRSGGMAERAVAREALGLRPASFVIGFVGRVDPTKGIELVLEAAHRSRHRADIEVLVVGPVDPTYLTQLRTRASGLACHWLPERPDVLPALHAADVIVVPSQWEEPFGRIAIEAMATGRPVVATRSGGLPEILTGEFDRFLVDRTDTAQLTAVIDSLHDWRSSQPSLAERCRSHILRHFTLARMVDGIEEQLHAAHR